MPHPGTELPDGGIYEDDQARKDILYAIERVIECREVAMPGTSMRVSRRLAPQH